VIYQNITWCLWRRVYVYIKQSLKLADVVHFMWQNKSFELLCKNVVDPSRYFLWQNCYDFKSTFLSFIFHISKYIQNIFSLYTKNYIELYGACLKHTLTCDSNNENKCKHYYTCRSREKCIKLTDVEVDIKQNQNLVHISSVFFYCETITCFEFWEKRYYSL